jgi:hypothetical protein
VDEVELKQRKLLKLEGRVSRVQTALQSIPLDLQPEMCQEPEIKERTYRVISPIPEPVISSASYWDV